MVSSLRILPFVIAAALLAACGTAAPKVAAPAGNPAPAASAASGTAPGPPEAVAGAIDPCTLVKADDLASFGRYVEPNRSTNGNVRGCQYVRQGSQAVADKLTIEVTVRNGSDLPNFGGPTTVNGRKAVKATASTGCMLAMGVGTHSRVDIMIASADQAKSCGAAEQIAGIVESRLPKI